MKKNKVFLDLDFTLARTYQVEELIGNEKLLLSSKPLYGNLISIPRPWLNEFLEQLSKRYEVYLLTAADLKYGQRVLFVNSIYRYFNGLFSTQNEKPFSISSKLGLSDGNWALIDDTPFNDPVLKYKLNCLGLVRGQENDVSIASRCFIKVNHYDPVTNNNDVELKRTFIKLVSLFSELPLG